MRQRKKGIRKAGYYLDLDRPRRLLYTVDAIEIIKVKLGLQVKDYLHIKIEDIPVLVWAGLAWQDPGLTIEDVRKMIQDKTQGNEVAIGKIALAASCAVIGYEKDQKFRESVFRKMGE